MKIWVFSDLHLEFAGVKLEPPSDADICVCAGDVLTHGIVESLAWLDKHVANRMPVIFVAGNHEYYRASVLESLRDARAFASAHEIYFLENDSVSIAGVKFIGATLWTDFALFDRPEHAMAAAEADMQDYKRIKYCKQPYRRFRAADAFRMHRQSRDYLATAMSLDKTEKRVVVTHHAPTIESISAQYREDILSAAYATDLRDLVLEHQPDLWVHGHIHEAVDYRIGGTRVFSSPRGYPDETSFSLFDPACVVEI